MNEQKISGKTYDSKLLKRMAFYMRPYQGIFWASVILTILLAAVAPALPMLIEYTLDNYILKPDAAGLTHMLIAMLALLICQTIIRYYHTLATNVLGQNVIRDIRIQVFNHITNLRLKYFDNTPLGKLITRTISDLETISNIFSQGLIQIIGDLLQLVVILGVMFYTDWTLTLIVLVPMPLMVWATYIFKESMKSAFVDVRTWVSNLNTFLQEHISGMAIIQYFSRERQEMRKFDHINQKHRDAHIRANWYFSIFFPVLEIILAIATGLLVWYGSKQILANAISPGVVVAFLMYINMIFRPIRELIDKFNTLQMGMVSAERIFEVLDTKAFTPNEGTYRPSQIAGRIEFQHVWFAYNNEKWVLKDVNFTVKPGETLALVGATGAGKSSTINILSRFYEIQKGHILLDGKDVRTYELGYLRKHIATVLQDVFLFADTIFHNITLHNPSITLEEVVEAAKKVGAYDFIMRLPGGFDYQVQERGATLSSGQAQLISFIRALVHDPTILILDEATSSIDTETELLIQTAIDNMMQGRTAIVIAHRLSTIQKADKIIVFDKGEIKEIGTHSELLAIDGYYKRLYDLQFNSLSI
ncbi:ABC transporter ATP-binding protein [Sphingobacterium griseoflavum]|uniref:Xenobiotic ABC transporter ATP-binding protein n=1 Tax=Sphingobacterium griseoflavum TaxID=1474952 RepID=A0ABQ3HUF5_9SPHI|nr:ABC transporter ATP-binding protein [Sphingobacterium griseoflavum]GHE28299.1 xenobiotic ABC transporter ATP-binding protein [Sphingobacterium griseoflavum]